ncbi:adenylate/guanylate cyclase domain-containing protein [Methylobacterium sp. NEAU K]|uniref:adenylate/guanylate cyclase domain-containing protein n=1 Tax=Methylobacterium sp. NEAU K TaxID=3064946 RepID=UPI002734AF0D|nr:adenylate/guanylate cyclase domain-containing protein [Methylobacterium sp. NEAU K]MDP4005461.1 adenylate/guanylate cyclase domain-containing protein [Methylobacterium sp. NEAU K]
MSRRLAAILVADIVGYSRLMGLDEAGTIRRLKVLRRDLIDPAIKTAQGRIVKTMGDGLLVEFPSPLRAVSCAVGIQRAMAGWEAALPEERRFKLRFGINVGDVVAQPDGDLFGDGVNVAARLEPLSEPGGLCVSRSVHEQVRDRVPYRFEDRGKLELKNIARPIGVFALSADSVRALTISDDDVDDADDLGDATGGTETSIAPAASQTGHRRSVVGLALLAGVLLLLSVAAYGWSAWPTKAPTAETTLAVQNGLPPKPLPPLSLVVLPFSNLSNDPEQDFFADGLTEDLTTDLSHLAGSFVIARNTAFTYKGNAVDVKRVGRDLGVRYALEGSVRRTGEHVVLNAQLISTETGAHIWADRFEGERARLGELQVEFVARLARSLDVQITQAEGLRVLRDQSNNPSAADLAMIGFSVYNRPRTKQTMSEARRIFERSLEVDPKLLQGHLGLARTVVAMVVSRWSEDAPADIAVAERSIGSVLDVDPNSAVARLVKGDVLRAKREFEGAEIEYQAAIDSDRNLAVAYATAGLTKILGGSAGDARPLLSTAMRLSPRDPQTNLWKYWMCHSYIHQAQWEKGAAWCERSVADVPFWQAYIDIAVANAWLGNKEKSQAAIEQVLKLMPGYTVQKWAKADWSRNPTFLNEYQKLIEGLRMAGLSEGVTD